MGHTRRLIRTFEPPSLTIFVNKKGEMIGVCPECQGPARLDMVMTTQGNIASHMAVECLSKECKYYSGKIAVVRSN